MEKSHHQHASDNDDSIQSSPNVTPKMSAQSTHGRHGIIPFSTRGQFQCAISGPVFTFDEGFNSECDATERKHAASHVNVKPGKRIFSFLPGSAAVVDFRMRIALLHGYIVDFLEYRRHYIAPVSGNSEPPSSPSLASHHRRSGSRVGPATKSETVGEGIRARGFRTSDVWDEFSRECLFKLTASKPRVSNITFSTVTSATGLPTIAVEPSRPRSSSYWKPHDTRDGSSSSATGAAGSGAETVSQCPPPSPSPSTTTAPVKTPSSKPATATPSPVPPSPHPTAPSNTILAPATSLNAGGGPATATSPLLSPSPSTSACRSPGASGNRVSFVLTADESDESTATTTTIVDEAGPMTIRVPDGTVFDTEELERDRILNEIAEWGFPIFHIAERYKTSVLTRITYKIFKETDLFNVFKLPYETFFTFFHALELGYWDIPYHNRIHAADVLHACYYLTVHPVKPYYVSAANQKHKIPISSYMSPLELMALFTAAAMHDYDHPGRTNAFLVASEDCKAILYNDRSVLENHHAAESWRLLCQPGNNFICGLDAAETKRFRYLVLEYILATDLKQHFDIILQYTEKCAEMDLDNEADRVLVSQMLIKLADVNSPAKPAGLHRQWTDRICQEFYLQGDDEKRLNLQISPYMNRHEPDVPKLQDSFISHIVRPLVAALNETGVLPEQPGLNEPEIKMNLDCNHQKWLREIRQARIDAGEIDEDDIDEPVCNGIHPPAMQCLPEEESEDSCSNSGGTLNNNEEFVPSPSPVNKNRKDLRSSDTKKPKEKENGCIKSEKPLTNGNGNGSAPQTTPPKSPPSESPPTKDDSTLGRFEPALTFMPQREEYL
uniref:Phosphodiesterase n=1 Tax=Panagrellus redivivus TaxID=6233 RepID=A0A7E4W9Q7_PANRE